MIEKLAESRIVSFLSNLEAKKVDFFALDIALASQGALGIEVSGAYPQFQAVRAKLFNKTTAGITVIHALASMKVLNPEITQDKLDKIAIYLNKFESRFDSFTKRFMIDLPVEELVNNVLFKSQNVSTNFTENDLVELLAGVFAV
jgi:hypothetical protein